MFGVEDGSGSPGSPGRTISARGHFASPTISLVLLRSCGIHRFHLFSSYQRLKNTSWLFPDGWACPSPRVALICSLSSSIFLSPLSTSLSLSYFSDLAASEPVRSRWADDACICLNRRVASFCTPGAVGDTPPAIISPARLSNLAIWNLLQLALSSPAMHHETASRSRCHALRRRYQSFLVLIDSIDRMQQWSRSGALG